MSACALVFVIAWWTAVCMRVRACVFQGHVFQAGGGLEKVKENELENERFAKARELATICGKPPRLCIHALALFQNNNDAAFNWLMDHGTAYLPGLNVGEPPEGSYTGFAAGADGTP